MKTLLVTLVAALARTVADVLDPRPSPPTPPLDTFRDELRRLELEHGALEARFERHEDDRTHLRPFDPSDTLCRMCSVGTLDIVVRGRRDSGLSMTVFRCAHCTFTGCVSDDSFDALPKRGTSRSSDLAVILKTPSDAGEEPDDDTEPA